MNPRIQLGSWAVIRTASSLKKILQENASIDRRDKMLYEHLMGVYSTRMFGLVFYRNDYGKNIISTKQPHARQTK